MINDPYLPQFEQNLNKNSQFWRWFIIIIIDQKRSTIPKVLNLDVISLKNAPNSNQDKYKKSYAKRDLCVLVLLHCKKPNGKKVLHFG